MRTPEDDLYGNTINKMNQIKATSIIKRQGFIGLYHPFKGPVYAGTGISEDQDLYHAYIFGENAIISRYEYGNYRFKENIEKHCIEFDVNRIHGMVLPPSEGGAVNNPYDANLSVPATSMPGMIQGAHRYSELSKMFPQITGMIIDDFWCNYKTSIKYQDLRDIKGALIGKPVDAQGRVDHDALPKTPHLKLFVVTYEWEMGSPDERTLNLIDGVNFWIQNQNRFYLQFDKYIDYIKDIYKEKEIIPGIYIHNSDNGDMSPESVAYLLSKSIDYYEDGYISGVLLFAGHWLVKNYISRERHRQIGLSDILNRIYYPYLGEMRGTVIDKTTGQPLEKAFVWITSTTKRAGIRRAITQKLTNALGGFHFSGWCGRKESVVYQMHIDLNGYESVEITFALKAGDEITIPAIALTPKISTTSAQGTLKTFTSGDIGNVPDEQYNLPMRTICQESISPKSDLSYPYCIAVPLDVTHSWHYEENLILSILRSVNYGSYEPELWDCDDQALKGMLALKENLKGCPCGIAIGDMPGLGQRHAVIIYWTDKNTWKFWDPSCRSEVPFYCRYVIA